jgi:hypothetical protein
VALAFDVSGREQSALRGLRPISKLPPLASEEIEAEQRRQQVDHIRDYFAQRGRLNNVAFRIRVANHRDCKNRSAQIGLDAGTVPSLPRKHSFMRHCR